MALSPAHVRIVAKTSRTEWNQCHALCLAELNRTAVDLIRPSTTSNSAMRKKKGVGGRVKPGHGVPIVGAVPGSVQPVKPGDVLGGDLLLNALGEPGEVALQGLVRVRPDAVRVRIVGAPDDVVLADQRHDRLQVFVLLIGDIALAAEIVARLQLEAEAPY